MRSLNSSSGWRLGHRQEAGPASARDLMRDTPCNVTPIHPGQRPRRNLPGTGSESSSSEWTRASTRYAKHLWPSRLERKTPLQPLLVSLQSLGLSRGAFVFARPVKGRATSPDKAGQQAPTLQPLADASLCCVGPAGARAGSADFQPMPRCRCTGPPADKRWGPSPWAGIGAGAGLGRTVWRRSDGRVPPVTSWRCRPDYRPRSHRAEFSARNRRVCYLQRNSGRLRLRGCAAPGCGGRPSRLPNPVQASHVAV